LTSPYVTILEPIPAGVAARAINTASMN